MDKMAKIRMKAKRNVTDLAGEKVMVDFEQGKYFCIKGVGNDIWDMLDGRQATGKYAKTAPPSAQGRWRKRWRRWFLF